MRRVRTLKLGAIARSATQMTCAVACLFALAWPHAVYAFTEPRTYFDAAPNGGGGGRFFTGSPAEGYGCSACHTGGAAEALQVEGLPSDGYVPGMTYDLRLSWPELAKRQAALRKTQKKPPSMGLVAELVAESGQGAGSVEVASGENAHAGELCVLPEGTQAAQLYTVRPGAATVESGVGCAAEGLGQRCLIAVLSCGARELRVRWTAPAQWQGPIWLSAGLVATDKVSGDPEGDSVTELSQVVLPSASKAEHYEARLRSGCSAGGSSAHEQAFGAYAGLFGLCAWIWTSRRRRTR